MSLLAIADSFYIGVLDLTAAKSWYIEKLGLQKVSVEIDDAEGCVALGFSKMDQTAMALGPRGKPTDGTTPMLSASNVKKAKGGVEFSGRERRRCSEGSTRNPLF